MRDIVGDILTFESGTPMKLTEAQLRRHVDERYVDRGREYAERGLVVLDKVTDMNVRASCTGSRVYAVELSLRNGRFEGKCTCPAFDDFGPCKHIAATAFAAIAAQTGTYQPNLDAQERNEELKKVRKQLMELDKSELVDLVMNTLDEDELYYWLDQ
jgi:uncharacterized Zn finger protein